MAKNYFKVTPMQIFCEALKSSAVDEQCNIVLLAENNNTPKLLPEQDNRKSIHRKKYSELNENERSILRKKAKEKLLIPKESTFIDWIFCRSKCRILERYITPSLFDMVEYLKVHGVNEVGIFRKEGHRKVYQKIIQEIIEFDKRIKVKKEKIFEFEKYGILELASALKHYIRDIINGLFDIELIRMPMKFITNRDFDNAKLYCRYLIYALEEDQRNLLFDLRRLFIKIDEAKSINKMQWASICNILSLTLAPQEAFTALEYIPVVVDLFKITMGVEIDKGRIEDLL